MEWSKRRKVEIRRSEMVDLLGLVIAALYLVSLDVVRKKMCPFNADDALAQVLVHFFDVTTGS